MQFRQRRTDWSRELNLTEQRSVILQLATEIRSDRADSVAGAVRPTNMPPPRTLSAFLATARKALTAAQMPPQQRLTLVVGNESGGPCSH